MWPKHTLYKEPRPGSPSEVACGRGFPFLPRFFQKILIGRCLYREMPGAVPAQALYKEVALEKVNVFLMPPLYSKCATSTTAITKLGETASDSPCTLSRALKLLKSEKKLKT